MTRHRSRPVLIGLKKGSNVVWARILVFSLTTLAVATLSASAAELKGRVINGTTRMPGAGDEVSLLSLSKDTINEVARTRTDRSGRFRVLLQDPTATHIVRVVHQGVAYHRTAGPGIHAVVVEVYDVVSRLAGVNAVMDVERFEATGDQLEVKQLITMRNDSQPPRTLMNDHPFEIQLPPQAQVQSAFVQVEDEQPVKRKPLASDRIGQYHFVFPLLPGDTRFGVVYRLSYSGEALIAPVIRNPLERFVVMLPKSMKFEPRVAGIFRPMPDTTPDNVQGTPPVSPGQTVSFRVSGTGTLDELQGRRPQSQPGTSSSVTLAGGGLGPPIEAPDPLEDYRWPILAGLAGLGMAGATYVTWKAKLTDISADNIPTRTVMRLSRARKKSPRHRKRTAI